jgi:hypothetical protein
MDKITGKIIFKKEFYQVKRFLLPYLLALLFFPYMIKYNGIIFTILN